MDASTNSQPVGRALFGGCFGSLLTLFAVVACAALWNFWSQSSQTGIPAPPRKIEPRGKLSDFEAVNIEIYENGGPSLVQVTNVSTQQNNWFSFDVQKVPQGIGSGFVWDADGHIVTNYHVVEGADGAQVTLADHSTYDAQKIAVHPDQDIAVLWIDAPSRRLHPIPIGTSHELKVGQVTYALGDPFGLDQTMTFGILSALGRTMQSANGRLIKGVLQTSTPINPGNSGGPLLDSDGRLIGMNTAIISPSGAFAGIGFAIPVDAINRIVPELIEHGKVIRPDLGVQFAPAKLARQLGVDQGALIVTVAPDGAAERAGLRGTGRDRSGQIHLGDVIVAADGKTVENENDLHSLLEKHHIGDTVKLTISRQGNRKEVAATLQENP
jgi:S1-C subfamily serine protease